MEIIKKIFVTFFYVLAGSTISCTIFLSIFVLEDVPARELLWQLIATSAICSLGTLVYYSKKEIDKSKMKLRILLHYLYINMVVIGTGFVWEWISIKIISQIITLIILIAIAYISIMILMFQQEKKVAELFNERLSKFQKANQSEE